MENLPPMYRMLACRRMSVCTGWLAFVDSDWVLSVPIPYQYDKVFLSVMVVVGGRKVVEITLRVAFETTLRP